MNRSAEAVFVSISVACMHTYVQTKVQMMSKQRSFMEAYQSSGMSQQFSALPGALFPSLLCLDTRLVAVMLKH